MLAISAAAELKEPVPRLPGPVFLSHASEDDEFVARLDAAIGAEGFETWQDAHRLVPGDDLPGSISETLARAGAFLVVISSAALASNWLRYELRLATQRMIQGELRVMPVRIEPVAMPPEVRSLLYADFTQDFDEGFALVLKALEQEAAKFAQAREEQYLYLQVDRLVMEEFDGVAWASQGGAYQSVDYNVAVLELPEGQMLEIPFDTVEALDDAPSPIGTDWVSDFLDAPISQLEPFTMVVTARPLDFDAPALDGTAGRVRVITEDYARGRHLRSVYFVDVSGGVDRERHRELLRAVRADVERRDRARRG